MSIYPTPTKRPLPLRVARFLSKFASGSLKTACADIDAWLQGESIGETRWAVLEAVFEHYSTNFQVHLNDGTHQVLLNVRRVDRKVAASYYLHMKRQKAEAALLRSFIDGPPAKPVSNQQSAGNSSGASMAARQAQGQALLNAKAQAFHDMMVHPPLVTSVAYWDAARKAGMSDADIQKLMKYSPEALHKPDPLRGKIA